VCSAMKMPGFYHINVIVLSSFGAGTSRIKIRRLLGYGRLLSRWRRNSLKDCTGQESAFLVNGLDNRTVIIRTTDLTDGWIRRRGMRIVLSCWLCWRQQLCHQGNFQRCDLKNCKHYQEMIRLKRTWELYISSYSMFVVIIVEDVFCRVPGRNQVTLGPGRNQASKTRLIIVGAHSIAMI
jgi:hypothetical protein